MYTKCSRILLLTLAFYGGVFASQSQIANFLKVAKKVYSQRKPTAPAALASMTYQQITNNFKNTEVVSIWSREGTFDLPWVSNGITIGKMTLVSANQSYTTRISNYPFYKSIIDAMNSHSGTNPAMYLAIMAYDIDYHFTKDLSQAEHYYVYAFDQNQNPLPNFPIIYNNTGDLSDGNNNFTITGITEAKQNLHYPFILKVNWHMDFDNMPMIKNYYSISNNFGEENIPWDFGINIDKKVEITFFANGEPSLQFNGYPVTIKNTNDFTPTLYRFVRGSGYNTNISRVLTYVAQDSNKNYYFMMKVYRKDTNNDHWISQSVPLIGSWDENTGVSNMSSNYSIFDLIYNSINLVNAPSSVVIGIIASGGDHDFTLNNTAINTGNGFAYMEIKPSVRNTPTPPSPSIWAKTEGIANKTASDVKGAATKVGSAFTTGANDVANFFDNDNDNNYGYFEGYSY